MEKKGLLRRNETYSSIFIFIFYFFMFTGLLNQESLFVSKASTKFEQVYRR